MPGELVDPVSAARIGCATLPNFKFSVSAMARMHASLLSAVQSPPSDKAA